MIQEKEINYFQDLLYRGGQTLKKNKTKYKDSYKILEKQVKSIADKEMHDYLFENIKNIKKNALIVSEECLQGISAKQIKNINECFIIDPIDGTASFVNGYPGYVTQIAYLRRGEALFSMVYAPEFDEMYIGIKGKGAYLNGEIIKIKDQPKSIVYIDNSPKPSYKITKMMQRDNKSSYMECGSIGLKICKIANGEANVFYKDVILRDWDLIPPSLILEEAGGYVFSLEKTKIMYFMKDDYSHLGVFAFSHLKMFNNIEYLNDTE